MKVSITYFKRSGKWYTEDSNIEWPADPKHFTGWAPFSTLHRIKDMYAVCMGENPLGFPQFSNPTTEESKPNSGIYEGKGEHWVAAAIRNAPENPNRLDWRNEYDKLYNRYIKLITELQILAKKGGD